MLDPALYSYDLNDDHIAFAPAVPRDSCKLLVVNTHSNTVTVDSFLHIDRYVPSGTHVVFNTTKVVEARIELTKESGGKVTLLVFTDQLVRGNKQVECLADRKLSIGNRLYYRGTCVAQIVGQHEERFVLEPQNTKMFLTLLAQHGSMPIPPYLKKTSLRKDELKTKYQSILAKHVGSYAAPTASLHFTARILAKLQKRAIMTNEVTLHVGYGTFAPLTKEHMENGTLHTEWYEIPPATLTLLQGSASVLAVGTTVLRTLESYGQTGVVSGETNIFIRPGFQFTHTHMLLTNFHVPQSSLMLLVQAFLEHKGSYKNIKELYEYALSQDFKFLSFGDAMLIV